MGVVTSRFVDTAARAGEGSRASSSGSDISTNLLDSAPALLVLKLELAPLTELPPTSEVTLLLSAARPFLPSSFSSASSGIYPNRILSPPSVVDNQLSPSKSEYPSIMLFCLCVRSCFFVLVPDPAAINRSLSSCSKPWPPGVLFDLYST